LPGGGKGICDFGKVEIPEYAVFAEILRVCLPLPAIGFFGNGWSRDFLEFLVGTFVPAMVNCLEYVSIERDRSQ